MIDLSANKSAKTAASTTPKWKVLLVDDEPVQRMLVGRMLTRAGAIKWFRDEWVIIRDEADQPAHAAMRVRSEQHRQAIRHGRLP